MRVRSPYDSPRVLRALLEEILDQAQTDFYGLLVGPHLQPAMQEYMDDALERIRFRGITMSRLFHIEVRLGSYVDLSSITFSFQPLNEDGEHLLKLLRIDEPEAAPDIVVESPKKLKIPATRVVEL